MNKRMALRLIILLAIPIIFSNCRFVTPYTISLPNGYKLVESAPGAQLYKSDVAAFEGTIIHFRLKTPWLVGDNILDENITKRRYFIINLQTGDVHFYSYTEPNERADLIKKLQSTGISLADQFYTLADFKTGNRSLNVLSE